jgi:uncharacterized membrane protein YfcA
VDVAAVAITLAAGMAMGWINNVAGGAGIFALWAFLYACDLPLALANPSARVAAVAIGLFSFLGYTRAGRNIPLRAWLQGLLAVPGALVGSQLALSLPDLAFHAYLAVVLGLLLWQQLRPQVPTGGRERPFWLAALGCLLIGMHMGYAQVGTGLVATLVLAAAYDRDLVAVNAAKSTVVILTSVASVSSFWVAGSIAWLPAITLAAGAAVGSYCASHWSVARGSRAVRRVVVAISIVTLAEQLVRIALLLLG